MTTIEYWKRIDADHILVRVIWEEGNGNSVKIVVPVKATYDEVPEPKRVEGLLSKWGMQDAPAIPINIRRFAIIAAQEYADKFSKLPVD